MHQSVAGGHITEVAAEDQTVVGTLSHVTGLAHGCAVVHGLRGTPPGALTDGAEPPDHAALSELIGKSNGS